MTRLWVLLAFVLLAGSAAAAPVITPVVPAAGEPVRSATPTLVFTWTDEAGIDPSTVALTLDNFPLELEDGITANETGLAVTLPAVLGLRDGNHTFDVAVSSKTGQRSNLTIAFLVNTTVPPVPKEPLDLGLVVAIAAGGLVLAAAAGGGAYAWARKKRRFTFRRHFLRHPTQLRFIVLYVPSAIAVVATLGALYVVSTLEEPPRYATEEILVAGAALSLGPFGLSSVRETMKTRAYERAFAQFLFELADAVRGGINPIKAVQELAKTGEGILKPHLHEAADSLRLGRPVDEAFRAMTRGIASPLVQRYASLVGEASTMGGSVAGVLQRAAKDMDDLVKIRAERRRALRTPVFTMYMAFGVLLVMVLQIISFAPNIGDFDMAALGGGGGARVAKMPIDQMQERFFHLLLVNAAGAGLLVGAFTDGKVRHGILHAIVMVGVAAAAYPLFTA